MARVVYCWELGAGYGHISAFLPIARALREQGHQTVFVLRDLAQAETWLAEENFRYLQAPLRALAPNTPPANSYAQILCNAGYAERDSLIARMRAWRGLYELLQPDVLFLDHAPTAALAARGQGVPVAWFGTGFTIPPRIAPMPTIRPWSRVTDAQLRGAEGEAVTAVNNALHAIGEAPIARVADLFDAEESFLCTVSELDHYAQREAATYCGALFDGEHGACETWPDGDGPSVLVYVSAAWSGLANALRDFAALPCRFLIHVGGAPQAALQAYRASNLRYSPSPLRLGELAARCDLYIGHGGHGATAAMLHAGRPVLLVPYQVEQTLLAVRLAQQGYAHQLHAEAQRTRLRRAIKDALTSAELVRNVQAFAERYRDRSPQATARSIASRCHSLLSDGALPAPGAGGCA